MKRQIINIVSKIAVLMLAAFSLCGCETWLLEYKSYPMTVLLTSESLGLNKKEFSDDIFHLRGGGVFPILDGKNYLHYGDNAMNFQIHRTVDECNGVDHINVILEVHGEESGKLEVNKKYALTGRVECVFHGVKNEVSYTQYLTFKKSENMGWIEFSNIANDKKQNIVYVTGKFECADVPYYSLEPTTYQLDIIEGEFRNSPLYIR